MHVYFREKSTHILILSAIKYKKFFLYLGDRSPLKYTLMLKTKIPLFYLVLTAICCSILSVVIYKVVTKDNADNPSSLPAVSSLPPSNATNPTCRYNISRLNGYKYIRPVYATEPENESSIFLPLKTEISEFIDQMKVSGDLNTASVYLKDLTSDDWMEVNQSEQYHPGSLFKVNTMITLLRMAESNASIMEKEIAFNANTMIPVQTFNSNTIAPGHKYKVKDLIRSMIIYSDNAATSLLHNSIDIAVFQKTFTDLGLTKPDVHDKSYAINAKEYSKFISVLYDGGYLTIPASEYAISLLSESDFKAGMVKELPQNIKIAHKFGEAMSDGIRELHECGIVYLDKKPYLVTIMTKGKDVRILAGIISHISRMAYDHMSAKPV